MHSSLFCFSFHAFDTEALLPQVSRALETRTELVSREKVPGLWKVTDRLNDRPAPAESSPMRGRVLGIVFLVLGLLLFLPSAMQPKELLGPLVGGAVAILWGLWRIRVSMGSRGADHAHIPVGAFFFVFTDRGQCGIVAPAYRRSEVRGCANDLPYGCMTAGWSV